MKLHDFKICTVHLTKDSLELTVRLGSEAVTVLFDQIQFVELNGVVIESIILDIEQYDQSEILKYLDNDKKRFNKIFLSKKNISTFSGMNYYIINPTYGLDALIICKKLIISKER